MLQYYRKNMIGKAAACTFCFPIANFAPFRKFSALFVSAISPLSTHDFQTCVQPRHDGIVVLSVALWKPQLQRRVAPAVLLPFRCTSRIRVLANRSKIRFGRLLVWETKIYIITQYLCSCLECLHQCLSVRSIFMKRYIHAF